MAFLITAGNTADTLTILFDGSTSAAARQIVAALLSAKPVPRRASTAPHGGYSIAVDDYETLGHLLTAARAPEADTAEITAEGQHCVEAYASRLQWIRRNRGTPTPDQHQALEHLLDQISGWKTRPYIDQLQCIAYHITTPHGRSIEGGETGIGKSLILLYTWLHWRQADPHRPKGLIVCTNSGKFDWEKEVRTHTHMVPYSARNGTVAVCADIAAFVASAQHDIFIVHYDALATIPESALAQLCTAPIGWVGIDEVHLLKNPATRRYARVQDLLRRLDPVRCTCATGTLIDGSPKSAWVPLSFVVQSPFPTYRRFCDHFIMYGEKSIYARRGVRRTIRVETGVKNLTHLKPWLARHSIRFSKSEVLGRPSKVFQTRVVELTGRQRALYAMVRNAVRAEIANDCGEDVTVVDLANRMLRLRQIVHHPALVEAFADRCDALDSGKYHAVDALCEEILSDPQAKILIWTLWRRGVEMLVQRYRKYHAIPYYGGSDTQDVQAQICHGPARIVVAIPEKAGTSVDFLKVCRTAIYVEKPWSLTLYRQSLDRIDRRNNTDFATIISIEANNTVDQIVNAVLLRRQQIFDAVTLADEQIVALKREELLRYLQ